MKPTIETDKYTLYHADCLDVLPTLSGVDAVITDPPYSIKHVDGGGFASAEKFYRGGALSGLCDFQFEQYVSVLACAPQLVAFHSRDQIESYARLCREKLGNYDLHFWQKTNTLPFTNNTWKSDVEYIAVGWSKKKHAVVPQHEKS